MHVGLPSSHWTQYFLSVLSLLLEKMGAQNWAQLEVAGKKEEVAGKKEEVAGKEEEATGNEEQAEEGRRCLKMV